MSVEIYLNSKIIGSCDDPKVFIDQFKEDRRKGKVSSDISISHNVYENSINISSSKGEL